MSAISSFVELQKHSRRFFGSFAVNLNLTSTFLAIKHAAPFMKKSLASNPSSGPRFRTASIIALSSIAGTAYHEHGGPYCVAKAGVDHLVRNAAGELGKFRIRVNSIQPGLVKTELADGLVKDPDTMADYLDNMPLGRLGETDDCGDLIRFLAGPESSWVCWKVSDLGPMEADLHSHRLRERLFRLTGGNILSAGHAGTCSRKRCMEKEFLNFARFEI